MIASVHVADVGARRALGLLRKAPKPGSIAGLRSAKVALAAPLGGSVAPKPQLGRVALVAFWDDDHAVDRFLTEHRLAAALAGGWHSRLEPLRAFGAFPGLPPDVPRPRVVAHEGPAVVLTLGRLRLTQAVRFLKASNKAENGVVGADGLIWATGMARPPFVGTCSLWESDEALSAYAYWSDAGPHPAAIAEDRAKPFHHQSAFIRFRPYASAGRWDGSDPLAGSLLAR
jgi:hypothetical protein